MRMASWLAAQRSKKSEPRSRPFEAQGKQNVGATKELSCRRESAEREILTLVEGRASNEAVGWGGNGR